VGVGVGGGGVFMVLYCWGTRVVWGRAGEGAGVICGVLILWFVRGGVGMRGCRGGSRIMGVFGGAGGGGGGCWGFGGSFWVGVGLGGLLVGVWVLVVWWVGAWGGGGG